MKAIKEQQELEGCTFAPKLQTKKKKATGEDKRDLNKFLEDQKKYLELKEQKQNERKEKLLMNEQSVMSQMPVMNDKSKKILEKKMKKKEDGENEQNQEVKSNSVTRKNEGQKLVSKQ